MKGSQEFPYLIAKEIFNSIDPALSEEDRSRIFRVELELLRSIIQQRPHREALPRVRVKMGRAVV